MNTLIATETGADGRHYDYAIQHNPSLARQLGHEQLTYMVVMRAQFADGRTTEFESACFGWCLTEEKAMERFAERIDSGDITLTFCNFTAETIYATNHERTAKREAIKDAIRHLVRVVSDAAYESERIRKQAIEAEFDASKPKFKKSTVRLAIDTKTYPDADPNVPAYVYQGLAIHQSYNRSSRGSGYHVSHVQSGLSLGECCLSLKEARLVAWRLARLTDWTLDGDSAVSRLGDQGKAIVRNIVKDAYAA